MSINMDDVGYWNSPEQCEAADMIKTLHAQVEKLTKELDDIKQVEFPKRIKNVTEALKTKHDEEISQVEPCVNIACAGSTT